MPFAWDIDNRSAPPSDWIPIVPDDDNDITTTGSTGERVGVRAIRAAGVGDVRVMMANGAVRVLAFDAGELRTGLFVRVYETGTTVEIDTDGRGLEGAV